MESKETLGLSDVYVRPRRLGLKLRRKDTIGFQTANTGGGSGA